ncbi:DUF547 domain-containing protein [Erythrobacter sp. W53]|uniref:DUF547 domain-containing protein n=1 Tax=Erythrobacter sp. W53 TaxID=3425947 RepID=UPI003D7685FE
MLTRAAPIPTPSSAISRRTLLGAIPAAALATACAPEQGSLGDESFSTAADSTEAIDHSQWNALLGEYVSEGPDGVNLVDYERMKAEASDALTSYLTAMQAIDIESFSADEQFAFWVNLYNAATVDVIVQNWPVESIRDIGLLSLGPWKDDAVTVSGRTLSLDNIEHDILRPEWQDVRIHYAVNCASIGCPNLATEAYTAAKLEEMLDAAAAAFVNHPRGFGGEPGEIIASNIFDWYQSDWGSVEDVLDHARQYAVGPTAKLLEGANDISGYEYDWSINSK